MTGLYQPMTTEWGEDVEARPCQNEGCRHHIYYQDGTFKEVATGEKHECKHFKKSSQSSNSTNTSSNTPKPAQTNDVSHIQKIEEYGLIQVEALKRHTDLFVKQNENSDLISQYLRVIAEAITKQNETLDLILNKMTGETEEEIIGGVQEQ